MSSRILDVLLGRDQRDSLESPLTKATPELLESLGGIPSVTGVSVTPAKALGVSAVFRAIALLSGLYGALPIHAHERTAGGARRPVDAAVIDEPHPDMTPFELWEFAGLSLFMQGNAYMHKVRNGHDEVVELWPYHPRSVTPKRERSWRTADNPTGKRFRVVDGGQVKWFTPRDILHIPGLSYDGLEGLSPIGYARETLGLELAVRDYGGRVFKDGTLLAGVLETDAKLDRKDSRRIRAEWREQYAGMANAHDIAVLSHGAKFNRIGLPPSDAQFLETRKWSVVEVCRWFGLQPHHLADVERSTSWGSGIEQQNMQFLIFTVDPWLVRKEQRVGRECLPDGQYAKVNRAALLRADTAQRFLAYQRAVNNGWMNPDEVREREDMDPIPDGAGQTFYRPGNLEPINGPSGQGGSTDDEED